MNKNKEKTIMTPELKILENLLLTNYFLMRKTFSRVKPEVVAEATGLDHEIADELYRGFITQEQQESPDVVKRVFFHDEKPMVLATMLFTWMKKNNPNTKAPNMQKWAKEFDLMLEKDKRTFDQIKTIIEFSQNDAFWKSNILSPEKLRKQFDQLLLKSKNTRIVIDDTLL